MEALGAGLHLEAGLHQFLADDPELAASARGHGVTIRDLRRPPADLDCATGANLEHGARVILTVGSDCAIGKMTVALEADRVARERRHSSAFVPTGQTGIAIAGWGIAVDAVVADYIAGAAERLVVEGARRADLLFPPLPDLVALYEQVALPARPARVAAIALNTSLLSPAEARRALTEAEEDTGLPVVDVVRGDPGALVDACI